MTQKQIQIISNLLNLRQSQVGNTINLIEDGGTVAFIARYRKEATESLDEVEILEIKKLYEKLNEADKRRLAIVKSIEEQGKMTDDIQKKLDDAVFLNELEDIYLPFKQKKKTKATIAIEKGLEPLAKIIYAQTERNINGIASKYINDKVATVEEALQGARDIMAEWMNENVEIRNKIRNVFDKEAIVYASIKKGKEDVGVKFKDYYDFHELLHKIPSHRFLAIRRGEEEGFLKISIEVELEKVQNIVERHLLRGFQEAKEQVTMAIEDSLKRLLLPSIENEYNAKAKEKADKAAIDIFSTNLRQLLLASPLGQKKVLAIDPGFRTGCKTVVLNQIGDLIYDTVLYPTFKEQESEAKLIEMLKKHDIEAIAIGNGTASRETDGFVKKVLKANPSFSAVKVFMVSEQGASIYSASEVARDEFPNKDITVRGAVSIGRRLMDPLAELVKIDPKSIGVGQYQHDVDQKSLKESLDSVVELCVNAVGVELNTASKHLLSYVSGIGPLLAQNIIEHRSKIGKFKNRNELKKVPRLGDKAFEQAAGFLRIKDAENPLDNSGVHPERYLLVEKMAKQVDASIKDLVEKEILRKQIEIKNFITEGVGLPTLNDIMKELSKPGRDPREDVETFEFGNVQNIEDLREGMVLPGIVTNITAFGCFVDIGVHQDGLVHVSQLADKFIKDPNEVVKVNQKVKVRIVEVEVQRKRIALSMKEL